MVVYMFKNQEKRLNMLSRNIWRKNQIEHDIKNTDKNILDEIADLTLQRKINELEDMVIEYPK